MIKPLVISKDFCISETPTGMIDRVLLNNLPKESYATTIFCSDRNAHEKV